MPPMWSACGCVRMTLSIFLTPALSSSRLNLSRSSTSLVSMSTVCSAVWIRMESPWPTLSILIVTSLPACAADEAADLAVPEDEVP